MHYFQQTFSHTRFKELWFIFLHFPLVRTQVNNTLSNFGSPLKTCLPDRQAPALGTHTIVLFGAGNEHNTAPYNAANNTIIRLGKLPCEPCVRNTCKIYGVPECLLQLDEQLIAEAVKRCTL